jgi:nitrogen regulatory protein A
MSLQKERIESALERLREDTSSDFAGVAWRGLRDNRVRWQYGSGSLNDRYKKLALLPGRCLAGLVVKLGRTVIMDGSVENVERQRSEYPILLLERLQAAVASPIMISNEVHGILLMGKRDKKVYTPNELAFLQVCAETLAEIYQPIAQ